MSLVQDIVHRSFNNKNQIDSYYEEYYMRWVQHPVITFTILVYNDIYIIIVAHKYSKFKKKNFFFLYNLVHTLTSLRLMHRMADLV